MAAFLRQPKVLGSVLALSAAGAGTYYIAYPYTKDVALVNLQRNEADAFTVKKIEDAYKKLSEHPECKSLLKKHLTKDVVEKLKKRKTQLGASLYDCISSGVSNLDAGVGVYAPDAESYRTFDALFNPIIEEYHGFGPKERHPAVDLGEGRTKEFAPLDPEGKFIKSTRIRCGRSLAGYPFNPLLSQDDYLIMEQKVKKALEQVQDKDLKGIYYPLDGMQSKTQKQLIADHFLFKEGDRHLQAANACNYWPKGRGIFHNNDKTFLIWVNEEDHMRIISMQEGSNVGEVLDRLIRGVKAVESKVPFSRDDRLGWLTFCPTNLGSTVRASVHIQLPKVSAQKDFKDICDKLNLQVRGIHGEHSESEGGVYDISNKARLGLSEYQAVKQMYDGVKELIRLEKNASKGKEGKVDSVKSEVASLKESAKDKAKDVKELAKEKAKSVKESAKGVKDSAKEKAKDLTESAKEKVQEVKETAKDKLSDAKGKLTDAKDKVAKKADSIKESAKEGLAKAKEGAAKVASD